MSLRERITTEAIEAVRKYNYVAFSMATGVGKSKMAIDCIKSCRICKPKILILIAERAHRENWRKEITRWRLNTPNIRIECYQSMKKCIDESWDFIVFDEAHHLYTDLRLGYFNCMKAKKYLFLSATIKWELIQYITATKDEHVPVLRCSLQKAIENDVLPEPVIMVHLLTLKDTWRTQTIEEYVGCQKSNPKVKTFTCDYPERGKYLSYKMRNKYGKYKLVIKCTEKEKYNWLESQIELAKEDYMRTREPWKQIRWLALGSQRKRYLGELKTKMAKKLLEHLENEYQRYICFCTSIKQAEEIGNNENIIHSKKYGTENTIKKFNEGKINSLVAVGMLQEGQNLNNIQTGVIIQLDGKERAFIQKFGRTLRSKNPVQHILCYKDTQDMNYLKNVIDGIDGKYIKYIEEK